MSMSEMALRDERPALDKLLKEDDAAYDTYLCEERIKALECELGRMQALMRSHRHTDACLAYAAQTGKAYCIASCADSYRTEMTERDEAIRQ